MNAERLIQLYDRVSDAPDAIPRLRRFILDLAVRGRLAGAFQDWKTTTLGQVGTWGSGGTPLKSHPEYYGGDIPWLVIGDLNDSLVTSAQSFITQKGLENSSAKIVEPGTVLIAMYGSIGKLGITGIRCATNQAIAFCVPHSSGVTKDYLFLLLKSLRETLLGKGQGVAQQNISQKILKAHEVRLPSLVEQHRIVAKVDELMALCDSLEAEREKREATRDRLTTASLRRLTAPVVDEKQFKAHADFAIKVLPELTTRPDQINVLRQTILDLAVRGKLVEQDPNDEPAEMLVRSIADVKNRAIAEKRLKRSTSSPPVDPRELAFPLPERWALSQLGAVFDVRDGTHDTPKYVDDGVPLVTSKNLSSGTLSFDGVKLISVQDHQNISVRSHVEKGDVLFAMIGSIGNPVIVDTDCGFSIKNVALFKYYDPKLASPNFLRYFLMHAAQEMKARAVGGLQPFVSLGFLRHFPIPLPPLAEQNRIVALVDVLMMLCDHIEETRITECKIQSRLLEVLLMETVQPMVQHAA